ncbi:MAG TPA: GH116 family glycosyl-hydrolase [Acidobacteriaceae bacterium]|nr:GH116 family glycosyl-hydrolase [Acidobacteriaceae bacterium]
MANGYRVGRRDFLKHAAGVIGASTQMGDWPQIQAASASAAERSAQEVASEVAYPRVFSGRQLKMISFPLGGVAAGSLGLGGRGQLCDWEIFNRPDKGFSPPYAFPSIWVQSGDAKPVARVLEARILPPYEGQDGLGSNNAPGLSRLRSAVFTGEYPLARLKFEDGDLPVQVELEAFSPFIPHDPEDSGMPVAILRYRVENPGHTTAKVGIAFSIDNPVKPGGRSTATSAGQDSRLNEYRKTGALEGLLMSNPGASDDDPLHGSFVLSALPQDGAELTYWRGWPQGRWWNSPMLFWDAFSREGSLRDEPKLRNGVGALCQQSSIPPGGQASFTFLLAWHFPNRTPEWCGWTAPPGMGKTVIGNHYATRFKDAWEAAQYTATNLERLESRTRAFTTAFSSSTLPSVVKEAASANLSTLASTTCFRTADGEFHGFEGVNDHIGCCFGNCTHVWNYETATAYLFPSFAKSLRKASFGYSMDDDGGMRFRQLLPDGHDRFGWAAADGQMGQIMHAYMDWKLSGDKEWLASMWPRIKKALEFAWVQGGWDANRDGVLEGVQHNTYDVEFYGPNPMCGIYYLGALRAGEEMARSVGDNASANEYNRLFRSGSQWIDANLFNGSFYVQQIRGFPASQIAPHLRSEMGTQDTEHPEYQVGGGCLIDQLIGQYLAQVAGLGPLVSQQNVRSTLASVYKYNYKRSLADHDNVERTFALNDEEAMVICDYANEPRPHIPFPYYAEVMTGFEHSTAALMIYSGMMEEGLQCIRNIRSRYDGEKRNPWDEAECGHHYARAMASWSSFLALSGFRFEGDRAALVALPFLSQKDFRSFWSTGTAWGSFSYRPAADNGTRFTIQVLAGELACRSCTIRAAGSRVSARIGSRSYAHRLEQGGERMTLEFSDLIKIPEGAQLEVEAGA